MARVMGKEELRIDISSLAQDGHEIETGTSPEQMSPVDLISGDRDLYLAVCIPLYRAAMKGDWKTAKGIFEMFPAAVRFTITPGGDTTLHIAAAAKHVYFVEEMVKIMEPEDLELKNQYSNTAFWFAAAAGIVGIAKAMVKKNEILPMIRAYDEMTPLHVAALLGHSEMVWYLYNKTDHEQLTVSDWVKLLNACISTDLYDVALDVSSHHPTLAVERDGNGETALHLLARKPSAFSGGDQLHIWNTVINSISCKRVEDKKILRQNKSLKLVKHLWQQVIVQPHSEILDLIRSPSPLLLVAAELGNTVFLTELIAIYPDLIWEVDDHNRSIFHIAVLHRQENIFNLIYEIGSMKDLIVPNKDENDNNILHLAGRLAPPRQRNIVVGAALQMQRELLWFRVEKMVLPSFRERKNRDGETPWDLFTKEHKDLMKEGEKWMRGTAAQSMLVATLIATVVFAAALTVPGGSNQDTGIPVLLRKKSFIFLQYRMQ
ncbi:uncharacterized protein LOC100266696 isoform X2 [Vitis vinifera]|uniref:uncharacterized protein LOC100266696 isoform X2 n=1 Tax=Vitis vinifera TaxID=29760 RepID=UPI0008FED5D9|nr:uncharacterized protein LOC100266696 isoform X2 [Vitis vinifera]|eukprot:XP_019077007.1 PREDICTED: uncharacterized protein LOC100266696 isoform X2 [Vitis vinifera]